MRIPVSGAGCYTTTAAVLPPLSGNHQMSKTGALKSAALAAAGAALLGGGMFLGFVSAMLRRREPGAEPGGGSIAGPAAPEAVSARRIDGLARSVADLERRFETAASPAPAAVADQLEAVTSRVEQLERRVEQLVTGVPAIPTVDQILTAVEQMVAAKIGGLDERLTNQVHAIEMLRNASVQTDALLHKLIHAVEALADQTVEQAEFPEAELAPVPRDYPIA